jgi:hypothetical protein
MRAPARHVGKQAWVRKYRPASRCGHRPLIPIAGANGNSATGRTVCREVSTLAKSTLVIAAALAGCSVDVVSDPESVMRATALPRAADAASAPVPSASQVPEPSCMHGCGIEDSLSVQLDPMTGMRPLRWVVSRVENASTGQAAFEMLVKGSVFGLRECVAKIPSGSIPQSGRVRLQMSVRPGGGGVSVRLLTPEMADPDRCFTEHLRRVTSSFAEGRESTEVVVQLDRLPAQADVRLKGRLLHESSLEDVKSALYAAGFRLDAKAITEVAPGYHRVRAVDGLEEIIIVFIAAPKNEARTLEPGPLGRVPTADLTRWLSTGALQRSGGALIAVEVPVDTGKAAVVLDRLLATRR